MPSIQTELHKIYQYYSKNACFGSFLQLCFCYSLFNLNTLIKDLTQGALPECVIRLSIGHVLQQKQYLKVERSAITHKLHVTSLYSQGGFLYNSFLSFFLYYIYTSMPHRVRAVPKAKGQHTNQ